MSVNGYLDGRASAAVLSTDEKSSINTSIATLKARLDAYFDKGQLSEHFQFGSSTRATILPRKMDEHSDIDYMVVFKDGDKKPQTYIDRLKTFAEKRYQSSEIAQSNPTVVLSLNHIKFELVPALLYTGNTYQIPAPAKSYSEWMYTTPKEIDDALTKLNNDHKSLIKPMIRLLKYWNAKSGYVYESFGLEKWVVAQLFYGCTNIRDYLFFIIERLPIASSDAQWRQDKVNRAKEIVANVKTYEGQGKTAEAEKEVKKLIPES
jgi:hypothetical protein